MTALYTTERGATVDLAGSSPLFGVPPAAAAALARLGPSAIGPYPLPYGPGLKGHIAALAGVRPENVTTGNGSDAVIDAALRVCVKPGARVAHADPTFSMVPPTVRLCGGVPVPVPVEPGGAADVEGLLSAGADVLYLCSPANPTGAVLPPCDLDAILRRFPGFVILDEAYAEYAGVDHRRRAAESERLLVVRTFSKAWGLAGLRCGYAVGAPALVAEVDRARGPYAVSGVAEAVIAAAIEHDRGFVEAKVAETVGAREALADALRSLGLRPLDSGASFLLLPVSDAAGLAARLRARGYGVRAFPRLATVGDAVRISVPPEAEHGGLLAALREATR